MALAGASMWYDPAWEGGITNPASAQEVLGRAGSPAAGLSRCRRISNPASQGGHAGLAPRRSKGKGATLCFWDSPGRECSGQGSRRQRFSFEMALAGASMWYNRKREESSRTLLPGRSITADGIRRILR